MPHAGHLSCIDSGTPAHYTLWYEGSFGTVLILAAPQHPLVYPVVLENGGVRSPGKLAVKEALVSTACAAGLPEALETAEAGEPAQDTTALTAGPHYAALPPVLLAHMAWVAEMHAACVLGNCGCDEELLPRSAWKITSCRAPGYAGAACLNVHYRGCPLQRSRSLPAGRVEVVVVPQRRGSGRAAPPDAAAAAGEEGVEGDMLAFPASTRRLTKERVSWSALQHCNQFWRLQHPLISASAADHCF